MNTVWCDFRFCEWMQSAVLSKWRRLCARVEFIYVRLRHDVIYGNVLQWRYSTLNLNVDETIKLLL